MNMSIRENIQQVRENIAAAALSAGRRPEDITLVGASKMNDAAACREAIAAGIDALGENRVQEMTQKLAENAYDGAPLHFIGHLQRNKVKQVVGKVALIESVGSYELLEDIDRQAEKLGIVQPILLEVNVGGEEAKSGFAVSEVRAAAERVKSLSHVVLRGLMTIPPVAESEHGSVPYFEKVHALYVDINASLYDNKLDILSMGMSGDYEDAVRCGATMVRVGTAIFGARHYTLCYREVFFMGLIDDLKKWAHPYEDEDEEYEDDFAELGSRDTGAFADERPSRRERDRDEDRRNKVVNIHATTQLKVVLVKPERFENASEIADHLKEKRTVVINLESTNKDIARRLIDFLSGVAYAGEGKIKKVAANTYIITPYHVDIMGDLIDELENNGLYL